ncbi:uroporphyrin-3 C-methyltransferase [Volucribacter psittacicida]|uniref:Uroporphyrin-3 C-methyltransferase n=1 Tax=Volucribacter psittacicida TaxID=203482 RepID=A0A4R1G566_9PAST|nr:uroporphyrinogen-III C-methyltransferase [Volucribacter psittacicida]TCJ98851.1 uroporphyrin-3 C-methyltransferase [Volucribacter psittacicida]
MTTDKKDLSQPSSVSTNKKGKEENGKTKQVDNAISPEVTTTSDTSQYVSSAQSVSQTSTHNKGNDVEKNTQKNFSKTDRTSEGKRDTTTGSTSSSKKGGTGLALLAILIALGVGAGGYYVGQQQVANLEQKIAALSVPQPQVIEQQNDDSLRDELTQLKQDYQGLSNQVEDFVQRQRDEQQSLTSLQEQVAKINNVIKAEPNDWILSEADFLLNNALRKLVLDSDVDTAIALLQVASQSLEQVPDARVVGVRKALNDDLKQLLAVNNIDQNAIMQRLSMLANNIDELEILNVNFGDNTDNVQLSDSMLDWKENVKKSAVSFLNHFIRITPRSQNDKALLAPNQDIYLRENIRLRLQIAILAVPRQQNELYKQSLEAVAAWVRSYFNTNTEAAKDFLQQVDNLMEQSIYVDVPTKLSSLTLLDELLHRQGQNLQRIELRADKALTEDSDQQADKLILEEQAEQDALTEQEQSENTSQHSEAEDEQSQPVEAEKSAEPVATEHDTQPVE